MVAVYTEIGAGKKTWGGHGYARWHGRSAVCFVVYLLTEASGIILMNDPGNERTRNRVHPRPAH